MTGRQVCAYRPVECVHILPIYALCKRCKLLKLYSKLTEYTNYTNAETRLADTLHFQYPIVFYE